MARSAAAGPSHPAEGGASTAAQLCRPARVLQYRWTFKQLQSQGIALGSPTSLIRLYRLQVCHDRQGPRFGVRPN